MVIKKKLLIMLLRIIAWTFFSKKQVENHNKISTKNENFEICGIEQLTQFIHTELRFSNQVKSDLLMNKSHDLRTHISGIYSMSYLIYKKIDDPKLKKLQLLIVKSSEKLLNVLEELPRPENKDDRSI